MQLFKYFDDFLLQTVFTGCDVNWQVCGACHPSTQGNYDTLKPPKASIREDELSRYSTEHVLVMLWRSQASKGVHQRRWTIKVQYRMCFGNVMTLSSLQRRSSEKMNYQDTVHVLVMLWHSQASKGVHQRRWTIKVQYRMCFGNIMTLSSLQRRPSEKMNSQGTVQNMFW